MFREKRVKGVLLAPALKRAIKCTTAEQLCDFFFHFYLICEVYLDRVWRYFCQGSVSPCKSFQERNLLCSSASVALVCVKILIFFQFCIMMCKLSSVSCMSRKPSDLGFYRNDYPQRGLPTHSKGHTLKIFWEKLFILYLCYSSFQAVVLLPVVDAMGKDNDIFC